MSSKNVLGKEASVAQPEHPELDEDGFEVIDEVAERERNLRPSVEMEIRAKVDLNHPDAKPTGLTLVAEERLEAREMEIERTRVRYDRRPESDREARSRHVAKRGSVERRADFGKRAASVDPWMDPDVVDAREQLAGPELGAVNRETARLAGLLPGWSRAAISRRLAERVVDGMDMAGAVLRVFEELQTDPGQPIPIAAVGEVPRSEVTIEGRVVTLWKPSSPAIRQVGLIEDGSGRIKFTSWVKSNQPVVGEGERVVLRDVAKSWYEGRVSAALTGWSSITFPERERWWVE